MMGQQVAGEVEILGRFSVGEGAVLAVSAYQNTRIQFVRQQDTSISADKHECHECRHVKLETICWLKMIAN